MASKRRLRKNAEQRDRKNCSQKQHYPDTVSAGTAIHKTKGDRKFLHVYLCPVCKSGFLIGHSMHLRMKSFKSR